MDFLDRWAIYSKENAALVQSYGLIASADIEAAVMLARLERELRRPPSIGNVMVIRAPESIDWPEYTIDKIHREYTDRIPRRGKFKRRSRG